MLTAFLPRSARGNEEMDERPGATTRLGAKMARRGLSASQPGCARIPMMARSKIAPLQRPDTLMQLSRSSLSESRPATHGRAIHFGTNLQY
jgi:hypothetical protein